jgi:hypothetical protein
MGITSQTGTINKINFNALLRPAKKDPMRGNPEEIRRSCSNCTISR